MATRQLYIDGTNGTVSIVNYSNATNARTNPTANLSDVYFHTSLPYLQLKQTITTSVTLDAKAREYLDSGSGSSGCGGCFITEACIKAKNLSDDDPILQTLRHFRDTYMLKDREMMKLVVEYYKKAPELVTKLDALPNSLEIYNNMYDKYILPAVECINSKEYENALNIYMNGIKYAENMTYSGDIYGSI